MKHKNLIGIKHENLIGIKPKNLKGMKSKIIIIALLLIGGYASGQNIRGNKVWSHTTITADTSYVPTGNEKTGAA